MIRSLSIRNLALIEEVAMDFEEGFNAFTGETGAGKTIIVSGMDLLIGARADSERIRSGEERLEVEGLFGCEEGGQVARMLIELGLAEDGDSGEVLVRRVITRDGKNRCWVNGKMCGASTLASLGEYLVDIHGQHEHQRLLNPRNHLGYLDRFGGDVHLERLAAYRDAYASWREALSKAGEARMDEAERLQQLDILRFQAKEIEQVNPVEGELEELEERRRLMQNSEALFSQAGEACEALSGEGVGSADTLAAAVAALARVEEVDQRLARLREELQDAATRVEEVARELRGYLESLQFEPAALEEAERRIFDLKDLYRKYGASFEGVMAFAGKIDSRLQELENYEDNLERLEMETAEREEVVAGLSRELTENRGELAVRLQEEAAAELADLGMEGITFSIDLGKRDGFGESGSDVVEFMISPGRGEPPRPIARIASGGELARLMLALKIVLARTDDVDVLVFDEVDAGIGGLTAGKIGAKMSRLAEFHQVITVTHLPQIAARACAQFRIVKEERGRRRVTGVKRLDPQGRREEIARMLGGTGDSALRHADELLKTAAEPGEIKRKKQKTEGTLPGL